MNLPLVSFGIPTYNEEKEIARCLASIFSQDYPKDKIEVIVIDDGSTDRTLEICRRFPVRIIQQRRDIPEADPDAGIQVVKGAVGGPEAGRKLGVIESKGEFVVLLSADNELASRDWLSKMVKPVMEDPELAAVRPPVYASRNDPPINRYLALMETKAPLEFYLFRMRRPKAVMSRDGYFIDVVDKDYYPPLVGGNGSLLRRDVVIQVGNVPAAGGDIDLMCRLVGSGYVKFGYVPDAVVYHHYARNYWDFIRRLRSKVDWFLKYSREYQWLPSRRGQFFSTVIVALFCATFVGPLLHGFRMRHKGDPAWLYHPLACSMAVVIYGTAFITSKKGIRLFFSMLKKAVRN